MTNSTLDLIKIMVPGDLHLTEPNLPNHQIANWVIDEANTFVFPDFVQFIGDNVQHATAEQFDLFQQLTSRLQSRWFALIGDHDSYGDILATEFHKRFGKSWGALRLGGFRFLRLNTQEAVPVGLSSEQLTWMRAELEAAKEAAERIIIFQHNYAYQVWEDFAGPGIDEWRALVQANRVEAIIAGHTHYWQIANDGRNAHIATRSIGDPEGGPAGYLLVILSGERLGIVYRTPEDQGPAVAILNPRQKLLCTGPSHVVSGISEIDVSILSRQQIVQLVARIDDEQPFPLNEWQEGSWKASFDSTRLCKGSHRLRVLAVDESGSTGEQAIEFVIDQTCRYTAAPATCPVVDTTNFC